MQPDVLISIVNWNGGDQILQCLDSLQKLAYDHYRIIVVDNASTDGSVDAIRQRHPEVRIIPAGDNLGYAAGNAVALEIADRANIDLLWILNPDAIVEAETLSKLVDAYLRRPAALYGSVALHCDRHGGTRRVHLRTWRLDSRGQPNFSRPFVLRGPYDACFRDRAELRASTLHGASLLIPLAVARQHGFMDTDFFLYSEEADYCLRLAKQGIPAFLVPASIIYHNPQGAHKHHPALKPVIIYYQTRNRLVLLKRHASRIVYYMAVARHLLYAVAWFGAFPLRGLAAWRISRMTVLGIIDAARERIGRRIPVQVDRAA